jgi:nicotinamide-nucleotide adenylyltransferase
MSMETLALYDLATLRRLDEQIIQVSTTTEPRSTIVAAPHGATTNTRPLLLLPGAFNPPTIAHLALARASLHAVPGARFFFTLGTTTLNKEQIERASLLDRLLLLDQSARRTGDLGVLLTNQGLYVEQAAAARTAFPTTSDLFFVVGYDKIEQIFDAHYYQDRDAALRELFSLAQLLVAPRAGHEAADIAALLNRPENHPFQAAIRLIPLPDDYRQVSSSQIRAMLQIPPSNLAASPLADLLPPEALIFCHETGCYAPPEHLPDGEMIDRYALRTALIMRVLALPPPEQAAINLHRIFALALSQSEQGRKLRRWLGEPPTAVLPFDLHAIS